MEGDGVKSPVDRKLMPTSAATASCSVSGIVLRQKEGRKEEREGSEDVPGSRALIEAGEARGRCQRRQVNRKQDGERK